MNTLITQRRTEATAREMRPRRHMSSRAAVKTTVLFAVVATLSGVTMAAAAVRIYSQEGPAGSEAVVESTLKPVDAISANRTREEASSPLDLATIEFRWTTSVSHLSLPGMPEDSGGLAIDFQPSLELGHDVSTSDITGGGAWGALEHEGLEATANSLIDSSWALELTTNLGRDVESIERMLNQKKP